MPKNPFEIDLGSIYGVKQKKKRVKLTPKERIYVWEHPKLYGRTCHICGHRITKLSDLELDHKHPYSKGGKKMNLAHRDCNRMKGSKSLKSVQKKMALKKTTKKKSTTKKKKKRKSPSNPFAIKPMKIPKFKF